MRLGGTTIIVSCLVILTSGGCRSTGVVPMNSGTLLIAKRSMQAGFGPPEGAKAEVYREANEFCDESGKDVETVGLQVTNSSFARPGSVSLEFRCE
jgi:hypothetical protein